MKPSTTGALLARDKIDRYRSAGAFGKPAYQSYVQMRAMLRSKRGEGLANYFAKPTYDPDAGELRWTAEVGGPVRSLQQLQGEDFEKGVAALDGIHRQLEHFVQELRQQAQGASNQPGGAAAFASLLEQAMKVPSSGDFLFFVGEQPVIAFWGFTDPDGRSVDPSAAAPRIAALPEAEAVPVTPAHLSEAPAAVAVRRGRPWWWWMLLALLPLALALLLLRACVPGSGLDLKRAIPGLAAPGDAASVPAPEQRRAEGSDSPSMPMPPGGSASGMAAEGAMPPVADALQPGASAPELAPPPDVPSRDGKGPGMEPPASPDGKDAPTGPDKVAKDPKTRADSTPPPTDPKAMRLPDDPGSQKKMDFLEGHWKAGEGLADKDTNQPLDLGFKFGKDGQGEVTLRRADGTVCHGTVQGRMDSGKLGIQGNQAIPCNNGTSYGAPRIECQKESGGRTQCFGVNPDGSRYFMGMQRQ